MFVFSSFTAQSLDIRRRTLDYFQPVSQFKPMGKASPISALKYHFLMTRPTSLLINKQKTWHYYFFIFLSYFCFRLFWLMSCPKMSTSTQTRMCTYHPVGFPHFRCAKGLNPSAAALLLSRSLLRGYAHSNTAFLILVCPQMRNLGSIRRYPCHHGCKIKI